MILRVPSARNCSNVLAADTGSCQHKVSAARMTSREATPERSLALVPWNGVTALSHLLAEDENASLAGKADFPYLPVLSKQQGIIGRLGAAVFPPAFGFGNDLLALLDGGLVSIDLQAVFAGLQLGLTEFRGLRNVDGQIGRASCRKECRS